MYTHGCLTSVSTFVCPRETAVLDRNVCHLISECPLPVSGRKLAAVPKKRSNQICGNDGFMRMGGVFRPQGTYDDLAAALGFATASSHSLCIGAGCLIPLSLPRQHTFSIPLASLAGLAGVWDKKRKSRSLEAHGDPLACLDSAHKSSRCSRQSIILIESSVPLR